MKIKIILYGLFLVLVPYTVAYAVDPVIAVPQFTIDTLEHKERVTTQTLTDVFIRHLVATSKFRVVERSKVDRIMDEIDMGEQGLIDKKEMVPVRGSTMPEREFHQELMENLACNLTSRMVGYMFPSTKGPQ
jgi:hypothetical protein